MIYSCFASTSRGLEQLLASEIRQLIVNEVEVLKSGVKFRATIKEVMQINLYSRIASRVMLELGSGNYTNEADIYDVTYDIPWSEWFSPNETIKVKTSALRSPLKSLEFVSLKVKDALCDKFIQTDGMRPNVNKDNPDIRIYNFLTANTITIYLDTIGESLFKRGYRYSKLEAPLKENLAAGLIVLSNWTLDQTLYDPMCGSGTIPLEALMIGLNMAPGLKRQFAFEKFKNYAKNKWQELKNQAISEINYGTKLEIYASDIDKNAIKALEDNLHNLGVPEYIKYKQANFLENKAPSLSGVMVTNPPYGVRLDKATAMEELYPLYASHLKKYYTAWDCNFLTADLRMPKLMRLKPNRKIPLYNGALECRFYEFKMVSGSNRGY
jgi:putative N6-adenine-specific DNA methylase